EYTTAATATSHVPSSRFFAIESFACIPNSQKQLAALQECAQNEKAASNKRGGDLMGRVVALMDDLFFQMKLAETAKHLGVEVKVATTADALLPLLDTAPKLVIVDLNSR